MNAKEIQRRQFLETAIDQIVAVVDEDSRMFVRSYDKDKLEVVVNIAAATITLKPQLVTKPDRLFISAYMGKYYSPDLTIFAEFNTEDSREIQMQSLIEDRLADELYAVFKNARYRYRKTYSKPVEEETWTLCTDPQNALNGVFMNKVCDDFDLQIDSLPEKFIWNYPGGRNVNTGADALMFEVKYDPNHYHAARYTIRIKGSQVTDGVIDADNGFDAEIEALNDVGKSKWMDDAKLFAEAINSADGAEMEVRRIDDRHDVYFAFEDQGMFSISRFSDHDFEFTIKRLSDGASTFFGIDEDEWYDDDQPFMTMSDDEVDEFWKNKVKTELVDAIIDITREHDRVYAITLDEYKVNDHRFSVYGSLEEFHKVVCRDLDFETLKKAVDCGEKFDDVKCYQPPNKDCWYTITTDGYKDDAGFTQFSMAYTSDHGESYRHYGLAVKVF